MDNKYGVCDVCGCELEPVWFIEEETKTLQRYMYHTGRKRHAVSHLVCTGCLKNHPVDDTFDSSWY